MTVNVDLCIEETIINSFQALEVYRSLLQILFRVFYSGGMSQITFTCTSFYNLLLCTISCLEIIINIRSKYQKGFQQVYKVNSIRSFRLLWKLVEGEGVIAKYRNNTQVQDFYLEVNHVLYRWVFFLISFIDEIFEFHISFCYHTSNSNLNKFKILS